MDDENSYLSGYAEGRSLDYELEGWVMRWADDRETFWKQDPENAALDIADHAAQMVIQSVDELVPAKPATEDGLGYLDWATIRLIADQSPLSQGVGERLQVELAYRLSLDNAGKADRVMDLVRLLRDMQPSEVVRRYLRRISRCYVSGFFPEVVILCRSVLDSALRDRYTTAVVEPAPDLNAAIDAAAMFGWIRPETKLIAHKIRLRGNKAIHQDPDLVKDVLGTVKNTMQCLAELCP